jgi:hypothetical protein
VKDLLSQWRGYTSHAEGIALAIPFAALRKYAGREFALIRVLYDERHQRQIVHTFMDRAVELWQRFRPQTQPNADNFLGIVGRCLIELMLSFKNPAFSDEHEWRAPLIAWAQEQGTLLRHHNRNGDQVPHIELPFQAEYLDGVLIGPGPYGMDEAIPRQILTSCGMGHVPVSRSAISL